MTLHTLKPENLRQISDFHRRRYRGWDRGTFPSPALWLLAAIGFVALCAVLYEVSLHASTGNSDSATVLLQGQDMGNGNLLLHGWTLPYDSYWTIDALFFMFSVLVEGVRANLFNFVPAVIAALIVFFGVLIATERRRGLAAFMAGAAVVAILGLPTHTFAVFFLMSPAHVGTVLWCLIAFLALRSGRFGLGWAIAVTFLAAGALGDLQMAVMGIATAFVAGLFGMMRARQWREGIGSISAAIVAVGLAAGVRALAAYAGAFSSQNRQSTVSMSQVGHNFGHLASWGEILLGVRGSSFGYGGEPSGLEAVHIVAVVVLVGGFVAALFGLVRGVVLGRDLDRDGAQTWRLDDLLLLAFLASIGLYVALSLTNNPGYFRYLVSAVVFATVLGARQLGKAVSAMRSDVLIRVAALVGLGVIGAFAAGTVISLRAATPIRPYTALAAFLKVHNFHNGIGDYWSASVTTVATDGSVTVRPVLANPHGNLMPYGIQAASKWYSGQSFEFLVYDTAVPWGGVNSTTATVSFGPVASTYSVGTYRVLVWGHSVALHS